MQNTFDEIRQQIHEIRNLWGPFDIKLASLDHQIAEMRVALDERFSGVESKVLAHTFKIDGHDEKITELSDRINWIELILKIPQRPVRKDPLPPENPDTLEDPTG